MRLQDRRETGQVDLFKSRLDQLLDMKHPLIKLAKLVDWARLEDHFNGVYKEEGHPPLATRLMAGLAILKHTKSYSDERISAEYLENPYIQYFCGEEFFQHDLPFDRSSMTRWRNRMGAEKMAILLQESLFIGLKTQAITPEDVTQVVVDTTVQEKAIAFPVQARLAHRARERLVKQAKEAGLELRQFYPKKSKSDLISYGRYRHAKQFKRARKCSNRLHTYLGRVIRDIERHIEGNEAQQAAFQHNLTLGKRILAQKDQKKGQKLYSLHAPEVECIGKGKAHKPYEFGVKVSIATTVHRSKGGQFVLHSDTCPGNPHDGKTLATILPAIEAITGGALKRILADRGYRGSNALPEHKPKVFIQEQKRGMTKELKKLLNRRACVEPVIGHIKNDHRGTKNHFKGAAGDALNATLAAAGYNFSLLLKWLKSFLCKYYLWILYQTKQNNQLYA
jgi:transposase, IS5 family